MDDAIKGTHVAEFKNNANGAVLEECTETANEPRTTNRIESANFRKQLISLVFIVDIVHHLL